MAEKKTRIELDPKVSIGHIISIVTLLVAAVAFFQNTDTKINAVSHEAKIGRLELQSQVDKTVIVLEYLTDEVSELKEGD